MELSSIWEFNPKWTNFSSCDGAMNKLVSNLKIQGLQRLTSVTFAKLATPIHTNKLLFQFLIMNNGKFSTIYDDLVTRKIIKISQVNLD